MDPLLCEIPDERRYTAARVREPRVDYAHAHATAAIDVRHEREEHRSAPVGCDLALVAHSDAERARPRNREPQASADGVHDGGPRA